MSADSQYYTIILLEHKTKVENVTNGIINTIQLKVGYVVFISNRTKRE